jgi:hypothetical protein
MAPSVPNLVPPSPTQLRENAFNANSSSDFTISPYILLPESFGDIYLGETFSAYVSVLNGNQEVPLYQVSLTVRLRTTNAEYNLNDIRPVTGVQSGSAAMLGPNENLDMVVSIPLNEVGTHTLSATGQFSLSKTSDLLQVKKFYRFNVSQPLSIVSFCTEVGNKVMIQSQVTNVAKSALYLEEVWTIFITFVFLG